MQAAAAQQEAYNKEFERSALMDVLMRDTPRPDDEATGLLKYLEACAESGAVPVSRFTHNARTEELDVHSRGICNRGLVEHSMPVGPQPKPAQNRPLKGGPQKLGA